MKIQVYQHIYTSRPQKGYGTLICHPVLSPFIKELEQEGVYKRPQGSSSRMALEGFPIQYKMYRLENGQLVFNRAQYLGKDAHSVPPRPGNYMSQSWVLDAPDGSISPFRVFKCMEALLREQDSKSRDSFLAYILKDLGRKNSLEISMEGIISPFTRGELGQKQFIDIYSFLQQDPYKRDIFLYLLDQLILNTPSRIVKKPIIADQPEYLEKWFWAILAAFPDKLTHELTLSSYFYNPEYSNCLINGTVPDSSLRDSLKQNDHYLWMGAQTKDKKESEYSPQNLYVTHLEQVIKSLNHKEYVELMQDLIDDQSVSCISAEVNSPLRYQKLMNTMGHLSKQPIGEIVKAVNQFSARPDRQENILNKLKEVDSKKFGDFLLYTLRNVINHPEEHLSVFEHIIHKHCTSLEGVNLHFVNENLQRIFERYFIDVANRVVKGGKGSKTSANISAITLLQFLEEKIDYLSQNQAWVSVFNLLIIRGKEGLQDVDYISENAPSVLESFRHFKGFIARHQERLKLEESPISPRLKEQMALLESLLRIKNLSDVNEKVQAIVKLLNTVVQASEEGSFLHNEMLATYFLGNVFIYQDWDHENWKTDYGKGLLIQLKQALDSYEKKQPFFAKKIEQALSYNEQKINKILGIIEFSDSNDILDHFNLKLDDYLKKESTAKRKNLQFKSLVDFNKKMGKEAYWGILVEVLDLALPTLGHDKIHEFILEYLIVDRWDSASEDNSKRIDHILNEGDKRAIQLKKAFNYFYAEDRIFGIEKTETNRVEELLDCFASKVHNHLSEIYFYSKPELELRSTESYLGVLVELGDQLPEKQLDDLFNKFVIYLIRDDQDHYSIKDKIKIRKACKKVLDPHGIDVPQTEFMEYFDKVIELKFLQDKSEQLEEFEDAVRKLINSKKKRQTIIFAIRDSLKEIYLKPWTQYHWAYLIEKLRELKFDDLEIHHIISFSLQAGPKVIDAQKGSVTNKMNYSVLKRDYLTTICIRKEYKKLVDLFIEHGEALLNSNDWPEAIGQAKEEVENYAYDISEWEKLKTVLPENILEKINKFRKKIF